MLQYQKIIFLKNLLTQLNFHCIAKFQIISQPILKILNMFVYLEPIFIEIHIQ